MPNQIIEPTDQELDSFMVLLKAIKLLQKAVKHQKPTINPHLNFEYKTCQKIMPKLIPQITLALKYLDRNDSHHYYLALKNHQIDYFCHYWYSDNNAQVLTDSFTHRDLQILAQRCIIIVKSKLKII